jgi:hypothetical protein
MSMKKTLISLLFLFTSIVGYSQNFTGDYRSYKTSFQDFSSTKNNFIEKSEFRIAVFIDKNQVEGTVIIQDPRIPKKFLAYKIIEFIGKITDKGIDSYLYKCNAEHLKISKETMITFYYSKEKKLSLMVYDESSSQVFFDLKIYKNK